MGNGVGQGYRALRRGRFSQPGGIYFITTVTAGRKPWFQQFELARCMCRSLHEPTALADASNLCWVVMPDHMHLLLQLRELPLSKVLNALKSRSAIELNREIGRDGQFWEPGFHERALRREEDLLGVARYIVANPLRARLVRCLGDYPYWNAVWL